MASRQEISVAFHGLVRRTLRRSRNFCATRHFYFGEKPSEYTLGLECPWRIRLGSRIIVGSSDYWEKAEGDADPSWEPGMPGGHLQDEKLAELLGALKDGEIITTRSGFVATAVDVAASGDIRIELDSGCVLEAFPDSGKSMQWILMSPDRPSLVLMDGVVNECRKKPDAP